MINSLFDFCQSPIGFITKSISKAGVHSQPAQSAMKAAATAGLWFVISNIMGRVASLYIAGDIEGLIIAVLFNLLITFMFKPRYNSDVEDVAANIVKKVTSIIESTIDVVGAVNLAVAVGSAAVVGAALFIRLVTDLFIIRLVLCNASVSIIGKLITSDSPSVKTTNTVNIIEYKVTPAVIVNITRVVVLERINVPAIRLVEGVPADKATIAAITETIPAITTENNYSNVVVEISLSKRVPAGRGLLSVAPGVAKNITYSAFAAIGSKLGLRK